MRGRSQEDNGKYGHRIFSRNHDNTNGYTII